MYNILLTGGSGFFGNYLKKELSKAGNVTTIGITDKDDIYVDLSKDIPDLKKKYDLVVHAAGKAHIVPKTEQEEKAFYSVNFQGTINLLKALDKTGRVPGRFVFISTVSVYGLEKGDKIKESVPLKATEPYGKSKIMAEQVLANWGDENGVKITILRLPLLIGRNAPGNLGAMTAAVKKGRFAVIGKGDAKRSMVFAGDVAAFIPDISSVGGVYNLTDGYSPSYKELADAIRKKTGSPSIKVIPYALASLMAKAGDLIQLIIGRDVPFNSRRLMKMTSSLTMDDSKARDKGWNPHNVIDIVDEWL